MLFRLAVFSDTHGDAGAIGRAALLIKGHDALVHLGDCMEDVRALTASFDGEVLGVAGNNDFVRDGPRVLLRTFAGIRVLIAHGHTFRVKYGLDRLHFAAQEADAFLVLYGHTHESAVDSDGARVYVNPGACRGRCASWASVEIENGAVRPRILCL